MTDNARPLILCADDFGMSPSVNDGIIALLKQRRISAVTCLVTGEYWNDGAAALQPYAAQADLGLHLSLPGWTYPQIVRRAVLRRFREDDILDEIRRQYDRLASAMNREPDFIDGHQHIHQLPVIASALLRFLKEQQRPALYLRNSAMRPTDVVARGVAVPKNLAITTMAGPFKTTLLKHNIPTNDDFLGVYNFNTTLPMRSIFRKLAQTICRNRSLFMLHPARPVDHDTGTDPIFRRRIAEFDYFSGPNFETDLASAGLKPARFDASAVKDHRYAAAF